jgi:4-amino-4-deoxy-L-arabinose transferase-like glycosyltransferase
VEALLRRLPARKLSLLLAGIGLLAIFPYIPATRSPNELCRLAQTRSLYDFHTVEITRVLMALGPVGDLSRVDTYDLGRRVPHYFPSKAPLLSYLAVPVYAVIEAAHGNRGLESVPELQLVFFGRLFCTVLPALLVLWPLRRFLEAHFEADIAAALLVTYALGSICFPYAELFMSHGLTAVLLFLTYFVLWRHRRGELGLRAFALAGLLAGAAVATEYTAALALPPLAIYAVLTTKKESRLRGVLLGLLGVLPAVLFLGWYHWRCFGSPFETGYKHLNDAGYVHWHNHGFLGVGLPEWDAFWRSFVDPLRGLFVVSPFLLLALPGLWLMKKRPELKADWYLALSILALYTYFTSSFAYDSWGWTTGPRHLTPLVAFLLLPTGESLRWARVQGRAVEGACAGLLALSIVNTGLLTQVNYISDCLRNGVHRLALPLFMSGHLPNSPLSILGVPNPWAWIPEGIALGGAMALIVWVLAMRRNLEGLFVASVVGVGLFMLHSVIPPGPNTQCENDTLHNIGRDFSPQPGQATVGFWGPQ